MKAAPLLISWHNENAPIYSAHFEPRGKGRLATAGGDNNVRLWRVESAGEERKVTYLTTLIKHTQAVNVVRFSPRGEMLASAGDDGNVLLWVPSDTPLSTLGEDSSEDKETWRVKHMCRSSISEIYDLAWSPDGVFFITGSMDNIARIYNSQNGQMVRQIAEHNHYVQGVAWDPLNEFVATQSSDRSVHIYTLKQKDGTCSLTQHGKFTKMDLPARRASANSPAPPEFGVRAQPPTEGSSSISMASPAPSTPGTPMTVPLPMNPPPVSHSRRSSFGSAASIRRSASPAPSMPLPAVKPMESSPNPFASLGLRNVNIYANETFTSFFRRLTFAPDGSLLFTPAGQFKTSYPPGPDYMKLPDDVINTVYIYTRAGFNKPPIAHLPGHKKPSVAVKCSPIYYTHRQAKKETTTNITIDTSSADEPMTSLPEPIVPTSSPAPNGFIQPPPPTKSKTPSSEPSQPASSPNPDAENSSSVPGPTPVFALPYRIVYAVATQDAVLVYDTQQQTPLCIVNNLHFATFTDLTWSTDGLTLLMTSSDGFCSCLSFAPGELGQIYSGPMPTTGQTTYATTTVSSTQSTPAPTPVSATAPASIKPTSSNGCTTLAPSPSPAPLSQRAASPARSSSASSVPSPNVVTNNPTPIISSIPSVTATHSGPVTGMPPLTTPPQTPMSGTHSATSSISGSVLGKREGDEETGKEEGTVKKRRIAPTLVNLPMDNQQ
ncbi:MAG: hypothetical protein M1834_003558 [Cirrosporium novae-zelandiae]|nr:MAG: hypothetical protein M1834_003558 [Cirrosporium novae-zelandiae]